MLWLNGWVIRWNFLNVNFNAWIVSNTCCLDSMNEYFFLSHTAHTNSLSFKLIFHIVSTSFKVSCCFKFHFQFFVKLQARKIVLLSHRTSKIIVKQKNNKEFVKQTTQEKISMIATVLGWNFLSAKKILFGGKKEIN